MGFKYPILSSKRIIQILLELGFEKISQKGSHAKYKSKITSRICIVPMHSEVARGTLKKYFRTSKYRIRRFFKSFIN